MEQVLDYHSGGSQRKYSWRGGMVLVLSVLALMISAGAMAAFFPGLRRFRFIRVHGVRLLGMALGPPVVAVVASIVVASTLGRRAEARRGRRLAIVAIVLSVVNVLAIVAVPVG